MDPGFVAWIGAGAFGAVVGWITYRTLRRREGPTDLSDIATVVGAIAGAAVTAVFDDPNLFGCYCIGLALGFFGYLALGLKLEGRNAVATWMGDGAAAPKREPRRPADRIES